VKVVLRKQGNSIVLALRASILRKLGLKAGQSMRLDTTADGHMTLIW
jgi:antitoxin component of MazEF toxin-antitoxin module